MLGLILVLILLFAGVQLLTKVFKVRGEDIDLMFAGAMLSAAAINLSTIIVTLVESGLYFGLLVSPLVALALNSLFGIYFLKKSRAL